MIAKRVCAKEYTSKQLKEKCHTTRRLSLSWMIFSFLLLIVFVTARQQQHLHMLKSLGRDRKFYTDRLSRKSIPLHHREMDMPSEDEEVRMTKEGVITTRRRFRDGLIPPTLLFFLATVQGVSASPLNKQGKVLDGPETAQPSPLTPHPSACAVSPAHTVLFTFSSLIFVELSVTLSLVCLRTNISTV